MEARPNTSPIGTQRRQQFGSIEMLSSDQLVMLEAAAIEGEHSAQRAYNTEWGDDCKVLKELEALGLMEFVSFDRDPQTKGFARRSRITDAGKAAWHQEAKPTDKLDV
jgi:hypothetical protein